MQCRFSQLVRQRAMRAAVSTVVAVGAVSGCSDSSGPVGPNLSAATLTAVSPTNLVGVVGTPVADAPAVRVSDARGNPIADVTVEFRARQKGIVSDTHIKSDASGIARLAQWTMSAVAGTNEVISTIGGRDTVVFTAFAAPGPVSVLEKFAGDAQSGRPKVALPENPSVRAVDKFGNALVGVTVDFVASGGGTLGSASAVTDLYGVATPGQWILGPEASQELIARSGTNSWTVFTARAVPLPFECTATALVASEPTRGELTIDGCRDRNGLRVSTYAFEVKQAGMFHFSLSSAAFATKLELFDWRLVAVAVAARDVRTPSVQASEFRAYLMPGPYVLSATSSVPDASGQFTVSYRPDTPPFATRCEEIFVVRGTNFHGIAGPGDCVTSQGLYFDRFLVYLEAGSTLTALAEDFAYSGPNVELVAPDGSSWFGTQAVFGATLKYVAPTDGYYSLRIGFSTDTYAEYILGVR
jgi:hypothetical protein